MQESCRPTKSARNELTEVALEGSMKKVKSEQFPNFTMEQMYVITHGGLTLDERLRKDKEAISLD